MEPNFLNNLSNEQKKAVQHINGPSIVLAGAGSGKTRVLICKTAHLLNQGIAPENIVLLTFTNKAADEMKKRIQQHYQNTNSTHTVTASTFHSFCVALLRRFAIPSTGRHDFLIIDENDQIEVVKTVINEIIGTKRYSPRTFLTRISHIKNQLLSPEEAQTQAKSFFEEQCAQVYKEYQKKLTAMNAVDFDDILMYTVQLFTQNKNALLKCHQQYHYILVDEYQDTNHAQYVIAKKLAEAKRNITIVGDFSQSIYSWRGADATNLKKFQHDFSDAVVFKLEENYRSTQPILDLAYRIISHNETHPILQLWTQKKVGSAVVVNAHNNAEEEAQFVVDTLIELSRHHSIPLEEIAILYRTNAQSRIIEEWCLHRGINYRIYGGVRFYQRKEVKDILAFVRYLYNSQDELSLKRIMKLGKRRGKSIIKILHQQNIHDAPGMLIQNILEQSAYYSLFDKTIPEEAARLENIKELLNVAYTFEKGQNFLDSVALVESGYDLSERNRSGIHLMTLHAAKGLEFTAVFIAGLEEGILPHSRSLDNQHATEEERRLFYVGITRAKKLLHLNYAKRRALYGRFQYAQPSSFLYEADLLTENDVVDW